jgi:Sulfotransferase family
MSVKHFCPVAIGGVGGSGTRVGAALLQMSGYYIGDDLNEPLDNLWFTLLFKRRSVLLESEPEFVQLVSLFRSRMSGETCLSDEQRARVLQLCRGGRLQHSQAWLVERAESFLSEASSKRAGQPWGWKEPNTHIVIDRIFQCEPELRYIHFVRHPLDMALSSNQNQLENWGPIMLNREVVIEPRQSLAYWCAAHRRVLSFFARWPARTLMVDFDALCANPGTQCAKISNFLGAELSDEVRSNFCELVGNGRQVSSRFETADLGQFDPIDLSCVAKWGYVVH